MTAAATPRHQGRILIVDDEVNLVKTFRYCLEDAGYGVSSARNTSEATTLVQQRVFDLCFLDLRLGNESGLELLPTLRDLAPWMKIVMVTAYSSIESAVEAIQWGAADYLAKPCTPDQLRLAAHKQIEASRLEARLAELEAQIKDPLSGADLSSASPAMRQVLETARSVADTGATVLIQGESGTGKGVIARAIHGWSPRAERGFVTINCPSLSAELLESELFGHKKGAFTGAVETTVGKVSQADGGTLFLDEIGDFPRALQPKLLRFAQDREYERVGDPTTRQADVRLIAATNQDLSAMVAAGTFREDLLYRLNVIALELPPLRERPEDIVDLAERFLVRLARDYRRMACGFDNGARAALQAYPWPGNVRELRNVVERAVILGRSERLTRRDLSPIVHDAARPGLPRAGDAVTLEELERAHIAAVMATSPTLDSAAGTLGIDPSTLWRKRKQYSV
ncbi:MAG: sigma-54-dependent Fis family transcriptional regulator [Candidatus Competibacter sp.]|nr:sigma-54-dependent Fis family transcriptional regulator [Candidatus Competibacter sp.]MDG4604937.1 sigma-54 dependent transcriptional regulator [Candidatus Contendobacter sp.]HRD49083.1 sigma-54 dependent transcriptional regulator [Candidatus Contendobacter sp.]